MHQWYHEEHSSGQKYKSILLRNEIILFKIEPNNLNFVWKVGKINLLFWRNFEEVVIGENKVLFLLFFYLNLWWKLNKNTFCRFIFIMYMLRISSKSVAMIHQQLKMIKIIVSQDYNNKSIIIKIFTFFYIYYLFLH